MERAPGVNTDRYPVILTRLSRIYLFVPPAELALSTSNILLDSFVYITLSLILTVFKFVFSAQAFDWVNLFQFIATVYSEIIFNHQHNHVRGGELF